MKTDIERERERLVCMIRLWAAICSACKHNTIPGQQHGRISLVSAYDSLLRALVTCSGLWAFVHMPVSLWSALPPLMAKWLT